jgi:ElaA protein
MQFAWHRWDQLTPDVLYAFLKLRSDIFVVEQNCAFAEMDGLDAQGEHLCVTVDGKLHAYLRLLPPGAKGPHPVLGRLVVDAGARHLKLGRAAMTEGLARCAQRFAGQIVKLSAQRHLQGFYASLGFAPVGESYLEDGIPHIDMCTAMGSESVRYTPPLTRP